ncbi:PLDc N-terminal domain-containing protein [Lacicoccus qingdaonensis]|nr:PLDc N-terminal domain-containing protein [Salinicoccus qingdaonensis]
MITALVLIIRQTHFKYFNKIIWIVIVLLLNIIGPVLYFILERR